MDIREMILKEVKKEKEIRENFINIQRHMPKGKIGAHRVKDKTYYFRIYNDPKTGKCRTKSLGSDVDEKIMKYQAKRFAQDMVKILDKNIKVLEDALGKLQSYDIMDVQKKMPVWAQEVPGSCFDAAGVINLIRWKQLKAPPNDFYPEDLKHTTTKGHKARSISESNILEAAFYYGIPYMYEPKLIINGWIYRPDSLMYSYSRQKLIYHEHFGKTNDSDYMHKFWMRMEEYQYEGLCLWDNLLLTFNGPDGSLDSHIIDSLMHYWFIKEEDA